MFIKKIGHLSISDYFRYMLFTNEILNLIAEIAIVSIVFINLCYLVAIIIKNFALVDFGWSFNFFLIK